MRSYAGFTTTDLLVVIAILAILAAIAPINLTESRVRSKVSRAKADMRSLTTALEQYHDDQHSYPAWSADSNQNAFGQNASQKPALAGQPTFAHGFEFKTLTTPMAYLAQYAVDPYAPLKGATFCYWAPENPKKPEEEGWIIWSAGPDKHYDLKLANIAQVYQPQSGLSTQLIELTYDPTNGITSRGDVWRIKE